MKLEVKNPVAESVVVKAERAIRVSGLDGKRVGLYWNMKAGGNHALDRVEALLSERFSGLTFRRYHGSVGFIMRHATAADMDRIAGECDVVVGTSAD